MSWLYSGCRYDADGHFPVTEEYDTEDAAKTRFEELMRVAIVEEHNESRRRNEHVGNRKPRGSSACDKALSAKPEEAFVSVSRSPVRDCN
jgi:hypothetical protein